MPSSEPSTQLLQRHGYPTPYREIAFGVVLLVLTVAQASVRYFRLLTGDTMLHPDARLVWQPLARAVRNGAALYVDPAVDNKPPLFEFFNILVAVTDAYAFTFLLCVALANGLSAVLLYHLFVRNGMQRTGVLAATGFVLVVPLVNGHAVNVRSFAVCAFLFALSVRRAELAGTASAVAVLFSQYLVIGVPVVWWWVLHDRTEYVSLRRWMIRFAVPAVGIVAAAYGAVLVIWGWPSFVGSLYWSLGVAEQYFTAYGPSLWVGQRAWRVYTFALVGRLWPFLLLALAGAVAIVTKRATLPDGGGTKHGRLLSLVGGAAGLFGALLFVRPYETYWLYSLPWFAGLAAVGLRTVGTGVSTPF